MLTCLERSAGWSAGVPDGPAEALPAGARRGADRLGDT